jgi:hypothetical protein
VSGHGFDPAAFRAEQRRPGRDETPRCDPDQLAWQKRAVRILADLLDLQARDILPTLSWYVGDTGTMLTGRSYAYPSTRRRDAITAWAQALKIPLEEHPSTPGTVTVRGSATKETSHGPCLIVLEAHIYLDDEEGR